MSKKLVILERIPGERYRVGQEAFALADGVKVLGILNSASRVKGNIFRFGFTPICVDPDHQGKHEILRVELHGHHAIGVVQAYASYDPEDLYRTETALEVIHFPTQEHLEACWGV